MSLRIRQRRLAIALDIRRHRNREGIAMKKQKHVCKVHTIKDDKPVCAYCGAAMEL